MNYLREYFSIEKKITACQSVLFYFLLIISMCEYRFKQSLYIDILFFGLLYISLERIVDKPIDDVVQQVYSSSFVTKDDTTETLPVTLFYSKSSETLRICSVNRVLCKAMKKLIKCI